MMRTRIAVHRRPGKFASIAVATWAIAALTITNEACRVSPEERLRQLLASHVSGTVDLPAGVIEVSSELRLPPGAHDLAIIGSNTTLKASAGFQGRAILSAEGVRNIRLAGFSVDGNRTLLAKSLEMAPSETEFRNYYRNNGIFLDRVESFEISGLHFSNVVNFALLVSRSSAVRIDKVLVEDSGSLNSRRRNNTTGGIVIEEGSSDFQVRDCTLRRIRGNGIWTHSMYRSPRLRDGLFVGNRLDTVGRDAIQVGHATGVQVENNTGIDIGVPTEIVDVENGGTPVAIDTAGNVDHTNYMGNHFEEIDGKCFDLDGFHDGALRGNRCINRKHAGDYPFGHFGIVMNNSNPDMRPENVDILDNYISGTKFGGLFLIGSGHHVTGNVFENLDEAGCNESAKKFGCIFKADEPEMLEAGIYLGRGAARQADTRNNVIRQNRISGHKMSTRCIVLAPGVPKKSNIIERNQCSDGRPMP
jgi:Right handed beta helix region